MFDLIREIYQTLRNNKLRTFLTGFAVAWGIFMLIILLGMARGVVNGFENSRGSKGTNNVNVFNGRTSKAYAGYKEGRYIQLKNSDTQTVKDDVKNHVDVATAFVQGSNSVISTQHDYISASYSGVYPNFLSLRGEEIQEGRFINDMDMQLQRKVLVITRKNARILFEDSTKVVGGKVVDSFTSTTEAHYVELAEGTYTLTETKAPNGYILNKDSITFSITSAGKIIDSTGKEISTIIETTCY